MFHLSRIMTSLACLFVGCGLVLEFAGGQDSTFGGKAKKEKGPKGDEWGVDPESKAISKVAEKATKTPETERDKWLKELNKAYPGQVSPGLTEADFGQWFGLLTGRGAEWRRDDAPIKQVAELFDRVVSRLNLGGVPSLRRNEFMDYSRRYLIPGFSPLWKPPNPLAEADKVFRQLDQDGSGFLEPNEWPDRLRGVAARVDRDGNGRISPEEYRAYFEGRVTAAIEFGPVPLAPRVLTPFSQPLPSDRPSVAIRYGHLPSGLPAWFVDLDTDRDGQIALHEWRKAGLAIEEFMRMDMNGDGLLPPDEYLRYFRSLRANPLSVDSSTP